MSAAPPNWSQQAKAMQINYQPLDDTPEQVEAAIRKYQELSTLDKNTEAYRRAYARNLMEQADALLRWGEQDEAERLASRAAGMQIIYGPFEQKPQDLLERIAGTRRQVIGRQLTPPPAAPAYAVLPHRRRRRPPRASRPSSWSVKPARRSPPGNSIGPNRSPARPNSCGCPTRPSRRAKIVRDWCCWTCGSCGSASRRAWCPPADST